MHQTTPPSRPSRPRWGLRAAAVAAIAVLLAAGCGDDDDDDAAPSTEASTDSTAAVEDTTTSAPPTDDTTPEETTDSTPTETTSDDPLGPTNVAEGEPVMVGIVSDGQSAAIDNTYQLRTAEAIVEYLNEHRGGIAGRPIELVECETGQDAGRAADCATELIQANVVVTVLPDTTAVTEVHRAMSEAQIPVFLYGSADPAVLADGVTTFSLASPLSGLSTLPIGVAEENGLDKISAVIIDVPAATELYTSDSGRATFEDAGLELELIAIPPGQADMTPQMSQIASGDPSVVHIVGNDTFCIAALNGLEAVGFDGPIDMLYSCLTDATKQAVGDYLEGVYIASPSPIGDADDPGLRQWEAIYDAYGEGIDDTSKGLITYATFMGMYQAIEHLTGEVTPAAIAEAIRTMPNMDVPAGGGLVYRCGGGAEPATPAVCTRGTLTTRLDANGDPTLPYEPTGNSPVED
jgi:branched-chain amino acid transport system substrate-binding protein